MLNYRQQQWKTSVRGRLLMKQSMTSMIAADYHRGLTMLKDRVETGDVLSQTSEPEVVETPAERYIGIRKRVRMSEIGQALEERFGAVHSGVESADATVCGNPFVIYSRFDITADVCDCTIALPIAVPTTPEEPLTSGERPACRALRVVHTGAYRHLPSAWALLRNDMQHRKLKPHKQVAPFERYLNDPAEVTEQAQLTEICWPIRA